MAGPNYVLDKGFVAGGALTKFHAVKLGAGEVVTAATAINDAVIGFVQEEVSAGDATNGRVVDVRLLGITRAIAGGTVTAGSQVMVVAAGTGRVVDATGATARVVGIALNGTTTAGAHVDVLITHSGVL